ncbi:hypothetical protein GAN40_23875, partial [Bacteroides thetaiotaomicron]
LSANSVMRGRLDARRTLKSLVADLRFNLFANCCLLFRPLLTLHIVYLFMFLRRESFKLKFSYLSFLVCLYTANIGVLFNRKNFFRRQNE